MNSTISDVYKNSTAIENDLWSATSLDLWSYKINVVFGLPAHSYIIWLIITGTESVIASEFINLNLSVCELCFSLNCLLTILSHFLLLSLYDLLGFLIGISITARGLFQCLVCVERYLAVVHPVTFLKYKPLRYRVICCAVVWIITLPSCLGCMYTKASKNFKGFVWLCSIQFLLFVSITLFCCLAVLRALKQSGPGEGRERVNENHIKRKAFNIILITTGSMVIIFFPFISAGFLSILAQMNSNNHKSLGFACFVLGGFVHPILFLSRHVKLTCVCTSHKG